MNAMYEYAPYDYVHKYYVQSFQLEEAECHLFMANDERRSTGEMKLSGEHQLSEISLVLPFGMGHGVPSPTFISSTRGSHRRILY